MLESIACDPSATWWGKGWWIPRKRKRKERNKVDIYTYLHHSTHRTPRGLEDILQSLATDGRLLGDAPLDEVSLRIGGDLTRDENVRARLYGLRLDCGEGGVSWFVHS